MAWESRGRLRVRFLVGSNVGIVWERAIATGRPLVLLGPAPVWDLLTPKTFDATSLRGRGLDPDATRFIFDGEAPLLAMKGGASAIETLLVLDGDICGVEGIEYDPIFCRLERETVAWWEALSLSSIAFNLSVAELVVDVLALEYDVDACLLGSREYVVLRCPAVSADNRSERDGRANSSSGSVDITKLSVSSISMKAVADFPSPEGLEP